jgi:hypothetical protein
MEALAKLIESDVSIEKEADIEGLIDSLFIWFGTESVAVSACWLSKISRESVDILSQIELFLLLLKKNIGIV